MLLSRNLSSMFDQGWNRVSVRALVNGSFQVIPRSEVWFSAGEVFSMERDLVAEYMDLGLIEMVIKKP